MGFKELLNRFERIRLVNLTADALEENPLAAENLNRQQLLDGVGRDGNNLGRYRDDPFFAGRPAQAIAYERYKARITPQTPTGIRNFFINGYTHSKIKLSVVGSAYALVANVPWGQDIQAKTGNQALGLNQQSRQYLWSKILFKSVQQKLYQELLK